VSPRRRPYDQYAERDGGALAAYIARARAFAAACKEQGWHLGVSIADGPLECATCGTPWPCRHSPHK
jgi:hypothetical protein